MLGAVEGVRALGETAPVSGLARALRRRSRSDALAVRAHAIALALRVVLAASRGAGSAFRRCGAVAQFLAALVLHFAILSCRCSRTKEAAPATLGDPVLRPESVLFVRDLDLALWATNAPGGDLLRRHAAGKREEREESKSRRIAHRGGHNTGPVAAFKTPQMGANVRGQWHFGASRHPGGVPTYRAHVQRSAAQRRVPRRFLCRPSIVAAHRRRPSCFGSGLRCCGLGWRAGGLGSAGHAESERQDARSEDDEKPNAGNSPFPEKQSTPGSQTASKRARAAIAVWACVHGGAVEGIRALSQTGAEQ